MRNRMDHLPWRLGLVLLPVLLAGCAELGGPGVAYTAPRVEGRVVDAATGAPVAGARVGREVYVFRQPTGGFRKGVEELRLLSRYARTDADGAFELPSEKVVFPVRLGSIRPDLRLSVQRSGWHAWRTNWPPDALERGPDGPRLRAGEVRIQSR